jgi:SAM-dependent methyltransferase
MTASYTSAYYDELREGSRRSAAVVVPLVLQAINSKPRTVVDVGCGEGWWGEEFALAGAERVVGLEGDMTVRAPHVEGVVADLASAQFSSVGRFDLAVSLEVAEHLPPESAEPFVENLCALAPVSLFSAAIPGQGGLGHVNERWPSYWAELFAQHGRRVTGLLRWTVWEDERVEPWYRQNLLLAFDPQVVTARPEWESDMPPRPVVHPAIFDLRRQM